MEFTFQICVGTLFNTSASQSGFSQSAKTLIVVTLSLNMSASTRITLSIDSHLEL